MPKHKPHHSTSTHKTSINLLTCLLRLRCSPPVPYPLIASLLLLTLPAQIARLSRKHHCASTNQTLPSTKTSNVKHAPDGSGEGNEDGLQAWLEQYLKEEYKAAETWGETWWLARNWDEDAVRQVVRLAGLDGWDGREAERYEVMESEELELQIRWRRHEDWRAGSTPLKTTLWTGAGQVAYGAIGSEMLSAKSKNEEMLNQAREFEDAMTAVDLAPPSPLPLRTTNLEEVDAHLKVQIQLGQRV